jgi:putative copper export protein/mono/diheme cytochrome c family protein
MILLAVLRGLHLAALLSVLGTTGFLAWILPAAEDGRPVVPSLVRLWRLCGLLGLIIGAAWFVAQAQEISEADNIGQLLGMLSVVAAHTQYGHAMLLRMALLVLATALAGQARPLAYLGLLAAGCAVGLQGGMGHAGAASGYTLLTSEWLHLLAAGIWLGALAPLWLTLGRLPAADAASVCERFSPIGLACVLVLAGTGLLQGIALIGDLPSLLGTPYGHLALLKIALFLLALVLATVNRLWLTDRLAALFPAARLQLRLSVLIETATGLAVILAAAFLASTTPGIHEQSVWPLSWQFTLDTVREDPDFRSEVLLSAALIALAALGLVAALVLRRFRLALAAASMLAVMLVWRGPSFTLLTAEAYPTSFQTSPTGFAVSSILRGQALYATHCVLCHGPNGRGDGPATANERIAAADLTQAHLWDHSDGELFWWLTHGIAGPDGGVVMPGFAATPPTPGSVAVSEKPGPAALSPADRWALIDYVRAHNAGIALANALGLPVALTAPEMPIRCDGLAATDMQDLNGRLVLVVASAQDIGAAAAATGAPAVTLDLRADAAGPPPNGCMAATPDALPAYAVLAARSPAALPGWAFLIDPAGRLSLLRRAGPSLSAAERAVDEEPPQPGGAHAHHH